MMQKAILEGSSAEQCNRTWDHDRACPDYSPQSPNACGALTAHSFSAQIQCLCNHTACYYNTRWLRPTKLGSALNHHLVTSLTLPVVCNKTGLFKLTIVSVNIPSNSQNFTQTWRKWSVLHFSFWRKAWWRTGKFTAVFLTVPKSSNLTEK